MSNFKHMLRSSLSTPGFKALVAVVLVCPLAACKHDEGTRVAGWELIDPAQRHPIMVSQQPASLSLNVARGASGLSASQRAELVQFASRFRASDSGNSRIVISAPSGSANEVSAMNAVQDARDILLQSGFAESSIAVEAYTGESRHEPPLRVSYMRYVAEGPQCGQDWSTNLANEPKGFHYADFGCSAQHNMAAMIANPADLLGPRTEGPRDSDRRDAVFGKYIKGEPTGAQKADEEKVKVGNSN